MKRLALSVGVVVWGVVFAGVFICGVYLVQDALLAYLCLFCFPQVLSSVAGAAVYVALLRGHTAVTSNGTRFALTTLPPSVFVGVMTVLLLDREMPQGWKFLALFVVVFSSALVFDGLFTLLGARLADALAGRTRRTAHSR